MRRVLLSGYYGRQNTGDDALLAASAWGSRRAYGPGIEVAATASRIPVFPGAESVRAAFPDVQRWRGERRVRLLLEAARANAVLFGGGSVFHSTARLDRVEHALRLAGAGPHLAAGVSIGPFRSVADERLCARVLRRLSFLGLRDAESAGMARALAPAVESRLTFDLAPLLRRLADAPPPARARRGVGIALCDYERFVGGDARREELRRARVGEVARLLDPELVEEIVLIDFNGDPEMGDQRVHADVASARDVRIPIRHVPYGPDPLEVLRTIAGLHAIVAMRLHAAVFGYLAATPTLMLAYHPKCLGWAEQVGLPASVVHDSVDFAPRTVADGVMRAVEGQLAVASLPVSVAEDRARLNFPDLS